MPTPTRTPLGGDRIAALVIAVASTLGATSVLVGGLRSPEPDPAPAEVAAAVEPTPAAVPAPPPPDETAPDAPAATDVTITLGEFTITPASFEVAAGTSITVVNAGVAPHELAISAVGAHHDHPVRTRMLAAGESQTLTIDLPPGEYETACHVPGHFEAGMAGHLRVT